MVIKTNKRTLRIGIYAGAFDPVHAGHVAFALQAIEAGKLDEVIFMPERRPRMKPSVEHYAHRISMLKTALLPHKSLAVLEVVDKHFTVRRTLMQIRGLFPEAQLVFLMGADTVITLPTWQHASRLMESCEFIIGLRGNHERGKTLASISEWNPRFDKVTILQSFAPDVSSSQVRQALRTNQHAKGLLASVRRYARQEWLYVSPSQQYAVS